TIHIDFDHAVCQCRRNRRVLRPVGHGDNPRTSLLENVDGSLEVIQLDAGKIWPRVWVCGGRSGAWRHRDISESLQEALLSKRRSVCGGRNWCSDAVMLLVLCW